MYICICRSLTDRDIRRGVFGGEIACMQSLRDRLGASTGCGRCEAVARDCLKEALAEKRSMEKAGEDRSRWEGGDIHPDCHSDKRRCREASALTNGKESPHRGFVNPYM